MPAKLVRAIGKWSLAALVLNSMIGSGIFGLPSSVVKLLGGWSIAAYLIAAAGMGAIMACFAEVASQFREAGGPYLYSRETFGRFAGIQVGWLAWLVRLTSAAANANLFVIYFAEFWPPAGQTVGRALVLTVLVGGLALVNCRGVSAGAQLSNLFIVAKLLPLAIFITAGLFLLHPDAAPATPLPSVGKWGEAALLLVFAYGGFEGGLMSQGETTDSRADVPFALFAALGVTTLFYILNQYVVLSALGTGVSTSRPLAEAARRFLGEGGAVMISLGALVSVYGYLSSQMLNAPRLTYALAEGGDFPPFFAAVHSKFRTPYVSILAYAIFVWLLAVRGSFEWNAVLSAVGRLFTYAAVCGALPALRRANPNAAAFRLPAGWLFAGLGIAFCVVLVSRMGRAELQIIAAIAVLAFLNWLWVRRASA